MIGRQSRTVALLVCKLLYELRGAVVLCWLMMGLLFTVATYLYRTFGDTSAEAMARVSPDLVIGMFGGLLGRFDPLEMWLVTLFLHPLMLTLFAAATIALASRPLAGEIERGTLDLLLACPVPRASVVIATAIAIQLVQALLVLTLWWSVRLGLVLGGIEPPASLARFVLVALNVWALFAAFAGVALLLAAGASEQGKAVGRAITFLVLSFFVNLLASFWQRLRFLDVLSLFHYHQPQPVISESGAVWPDLLVLAAVAIAGHLGALVLFVRRDLEAG